MKTAHAHVPKFFGHDYDGTYHDCAKCFLNIQPNEDWDYEIDYEDNSCSYFHLNCPTWPDHVDHLQPCIRCNKKLGFDHTNWDFSIEIDDEGQDKFIYFHQTCLPF